MAEASDNLSDELWRLNNLYFIKDEDGNKVRFSMNRAQTLLYTTMWFLNIILKARQLGMTTFIQIFMLDRCLFNDDTDAGIIAQTLPDAAKFFDRKIKFAYDNLPEDLKKAIPADTSNTRELKFANGSSIYVGTSLRSGTYQYVHISEFGKICAENPKLAAEIVSGTLNTVHTGKFIWIESTAEGTHGYFYDMCLAAEKLMEAANDKRATLTQMDYKFFFFPWFWHKDYVLKGVHVTITEAMQEYFDTLRAEHGIELTYEQMAWYVKKEEKQQDLMKREFPSTSAEAFEKLLKGIIFAAQLLTVRKEHRITKLPHERGVAVNSFWDLGYNDINAIWFHQRVGAWDHFIKYYEHRLVDMTHYVEILNEYEKEFGWQWGTQYLPHDGKAKHIESVAGSAKDILERAGFRVKVVNRPTQKNLSIQPTRQAFSHCRFDEENCADGIKMLEGYKWTWDDQQETFRRIPTHNFASNGADAFQTYGFGYKGDGGSFRAQINQLDGSGGRQYRKSRQAHNPLTNPDYSHVI